MTLRELRLKNGFTQEECAALFSMTRRTYSKYENNQDLVNTIKYKYIYSELEKRIYVDEEHGILKIEDIKEIVTQVLNKYDVKLCYLFGSYAKGYATETSDVDLLIDTEITGLAYFGLVEDLRTNLHKVVDLVNLNTTTSPELLSEILKDGVKIYG